MIYASEADLDSVWGASLIDLLTLDAQTAQRDAAKIAEALADASAQIDSFAARRYALPLTLTDAGVRMTRGVCADLAVYRLATTADRMTEIITRRYDQAIRFLEAVAAGKAEIATTAVAGGASGQSGPAISPNEAVIVAPARVFDRDTLRSI
jgi:phage gp36-like protein